MVSGAMSNVQQLCPGQATRKEGCEGRDSENQRGGRSALSFPPPEGGMNSKALEDLCPVAPDRPPFLPNPRAGLCGAEVSGPSSLSLGLSPRPSASSGPTGLAALTSPGDTARAQLPFGPSAPGRQGQQGQSWGAPSRSGQRGSHCELGLWARLAQILAVFPGAWTLGRLTISHSLLVPWGVGSLCLFWAQARG